MNFGTEFTELAATTGADKKSEKSSGCLLTGKQWALVIALGIAIAVGIDLWLHYAGL